MLRHVVAALASLVSTLLPVAAASAAPQTVYFASADGHTTLTGYVFQPSTPGPWPAVVMLHGRGGPYSSNDNADCTFVGAGIASACNANTLSKRHAMWGDYWSARGYLALLPDSFGPRGKASGFGRFTHGDADRADVNEIDVRPLDAEGALAYLRGRGYAVADQIYLQGWSNGGSTALNVMIRQGNQQADEASYRGALVFYPGCGQAALLTSTISIAAPIAMFLGADDEEVSPAICLRLADRSRQAGSPIDVTVYPGATHDFDEPSSRRQAAPGNQSAMDDALVKAIAIVGGWKK
ncbi:dienelactone hydrolase family protein [Bradyrhizobium campsiandrae]|uniref:Dienelactone hydrolase family protein n=1 Tax=Bradyrhizobium campsiandrae TaxID=1729892 RepID=A0ABR7UDS0_9BRAD|nr:dienelactone hydrolase family protein [Bradyrhizobium campsiandrae]MBC9982053.1 dienelactone hydrolase family protein [Bradyrhizobium campsiandrae]